jgi:mRNA interferase HigB
VNVISKSGLAELIKAKRVDAATTTELDAWYRAAHNAKWTNLADVRESFPSADRVGHVVIFNVRHNRYRLITREVFAKQKLYVKALLTHKEYAREEWKKWA